MSRDVSGCHSEGLLQASSRQRQGMLLTVPAKSDLVQVSVAKGSKKPSVPGSPQEEH
jgi:hypothetical protein